MLNNLVSGNAVIGRVIVDYKLDYSDWIANAPYWMSNALSNMDMFTHIIKRKISFMNSVAKLPCDLKGLLGVSYNGVRLDRSGAVISNFQEEPNSLPSSVIIESTQKKQNYALNGNGWITINLYNGVTSGEVVIYYKGIPSELDAETNVRLPKVPDNEKVISAIATYIVYMCIARGHKHPVYNLTDNSPYTNIGIKWDKARKLAMNSLSNLDRDERKNLSEIITTFIDNVDGVYNSQYIYEEYEY